MKRKAVIALYLEGKTNIQIRRARPKLKLGEQFVRRTIKRFEETGSIKKRFGGGRKRNSTPRKSERIAETMDVERLQCDICGRWYD